MGRSDSPIIERRSELRARILRTPIDPNLPLTRIGLPVLTFLILTSFGLLLFRNEQINLAADIQDDTSLVRQQLARRIEKGLNDEFRPLRRLSKDIVSKLLGTPEQFHRECESLQSQIAEYRRMLWMDSNGVCIGDSASPTPELVGVDLGSDPLRRALVASRREEGAIAASTPGEWFFVMPIRAAPESEPSGAVAARVLVSRVIERLIDANTGDLFAMELRDDRGHAALVSSRGQTCPPEFAAIEPVSVIGKTWKLRVWPKPAFMAQKSLRVAWIDLIGMALLALVASICVSQTIEHWRRSFAHAAAIEALNDVAAAITGSPELSQLALERVTKLAAGMLAMPMVSLNLFNPEDQTITVVYRDGLRLDLRNRYHLSELRANDECFQTGRPLFVRDIHGDSGLFHESPLLKLGIRSVAVMPLMVRGEPIGAISLFDRRPRTFSNSAVRMAMLWAAQAAIIVRNAELYRRIEDARRRQVRMTEQLETLYRVNLDIQSATSLEESLQRIADLSPAALEMEVCVVALPTGGEVEFRLASVTQLDPPFPLLAGTISRRDHAWKSLMSRQPVTVVDARNDPTLTTVGWPVGSALYVPLVAGGDAIGVMALYRREPGEFPPEQVQLAELFAAKAAVAIENSRLFEQTRRDADTKAVLLRELNHRVKNNLAAIAGLLSTSPADMPADARQWLDRVIDRIDGTARVHEMFVNGSIAVTLPELIRKAVGSILETRPPGVTVQLNLAGDNIRLRSDRAVALAMALHELCFNALRHGVPESGTISMRSWADDEATVTIEVMDDGGANDRDGRLSGMNFADLNVSGSDAAVAVLRRVDGRAGKTGVGLSLVRGLVGRELRGKFSIAPRSVGGTVATIIFSAH